MKVGMNRKRTTGERHGTANCATSVASNASRHTLTVRVSMDLRKRGGRKLVVVPGDAAANSRKRQSLVEAESPLVKLLARGFYWKRLFDSGVYASLNELAAAEKVDRSYLSKVLRLTLLAPSVVEAIFDGGEFEQLTIETLLVGVPLAWQEQVQTLGARG